MRDVSKAGLALAALAFSTMPALAFSTVSYIQQTSLYQTSVVSAGGFNVEVHGSPAPGMDAAASVAGLHGPSWVGGAPLKPLAADAKPGKGTRLVLVFNGAAAPSEAACEDGAGQGGASAGAGARLHAIAVYCMGDRMVARGAVSGDAVSGPGDAAYVSAMQQLLAAMFPPQPVTISPFGGGI